MPLWLLRNGDDRRKKTHGWRVLIGRKGCVASAAQIAIEIVEVESCRNT
jgi:hypothetical protein